MKKLLEQCLAVLERDVDIDYGCGHCGGMGVHRDNCDLLSTIASLRTQLAALSPDAGHAEAILAHADGLEDEGNWRAELVRVVMNGAHLLDVISGLEVIHRLSMSRHLSAIIESNRVASREAVTAITGSTAIFAQDNGGAP